MSKTFTVDFEFPEVARISCCSPANIIAQTFLMPSLISQHVVLLFLKLNNQHDWLKTRDGGANGGCMINLLPIGISIMDQSSEI